MGLSEADRRAVEEFRQTVVEPSRNALVVLDFWAEWCGPCKQLTPVLEKVCADYAGKGVMLAKVNVDENRFIAGQFRVQSVPTVYAIFQGQPVADLSQARTEGQLKQMLDQILAQLPIESEEKQLSEQIVPMLEMGEEVLSQGDYERAVSIFSQLVQMAPHSPEALAGLLRSLAANGQLDEAEEMLSLASPELLKSPLVQQARAAIELARATKPVTDLSGLEAQVAANPDDLEARFELANGYMANGDRQGAADQLLDIIGRDRGWNDGAARTQFLTLLEAVGLEDPWTSAQRRRLSAILFT